MSSSLSSSVVIQTSFLGDVVLTTPLLESLAARGPVDVVTTPAGATLLRGHPAVRGVIAYDKRGAESGFGGMLRLASRLRAAKYDAAYLAQGSTRSAAIARLAGIRERVGFDTSGGRWLYSRKVGHDGTAHHAVRLWTLANAGATPPAALRPSLAPQAADAAAVDALLAGVPRDGATFVALAPGSVWGTKRWPHFPQLASRLAPLHRLVVVGGEADGPHAAAIAAAAGPERVVDATGRLSLLASAALLARCAALVTNDSAPLHLASAMNTPTVAIFGSTVPAFGFGPLAERRAVAEFVGLACRPCGAHGPMTCPLGHFRCMTDLAVDRVLDAFHAVTAPPR